MNSNALWLLAADAALFSHLLLVLFVILGLLLIFLGRLWQWSWVRNPWFRLAHLGTIAIVVLQSWFGIVCPLTTLEMWFRGKAGEAVYSGTFISHWMNSLLYYEAAPWVFAVCYTVFVVLVVACWFWVRPNAISKHNPRVST
jgi:hypothetical protein